MIDMDQGNQEETCLLDETTTVIFENALIARRRRTEIRRFKRFSCLSTSSRTSSSVQQGTFKRTRPVRASSICSICYCSNDAKGRSDIFSHTRPLDEQQLSLSSKIVGELKVPDPLGEDELFVRGSGLARSKSFPQCVHAGRCLLHVKKSIGDCAVMDVGSGFTSFVTKNQTSPVNNTPSECSISSPKASAGADLDGMNAIIYTGVVGNESIGSSAHCKQGDHLFCDSSRSCSGNTALSMHMQGLEKKSPAGHAEECTTKVLKGSSAFLERQISGRGPCPLSGKVLVCGRRREMEDMAVIAPHFTRIPFAGDPHGVKEFCDLHFFGIYDGHSGAQASSFCAGRLHHALSEELLGSQVTEEMEDVAEWTRVMASCFLKVDKEVGGICPSGRCDDIDASATCCMNAVAPENVGTTAVVAVLTPSQIVVANCGDSRAVLSRGGRVIPLSKDHKPERDDETSRIEAAGGRVIYWDGYRVAGLLALSRALGDRYLKKYVISEPDVLCLPRADDDECLILASDGLWDVISNETACDVARRCLASARRRQEHRISVVGEDSACAQVAALLVKLAYGRGSKDNISVVVVDLKYEHL